MKIAIYPGSFDPITFGHLDVVERASRLFEQVIVTVARNTSKTPLFTPAERVDLIETALSDMTLSAPVKVETFDGLIVDYAQSKGAKAIIRGLRAVSDFEYEMQMALVNRRLNSAITTVFLMPHEKYTYLNSSIVKEVASFNGDISNFVPECVRTEVVARLTEKK